MKQRFAWERLFFLVIIVGVLIGGSIFAYNYFTGNGTPVQQTQVPNSGPIQPPITQPGTTPNTVPTTPNQPGTKVDNRPIIKVGSDSFGSFFVLMQIAQDSTLPFRLDVVPYGFPGVGNPSEQVRGTDLYNGDLDVLLITDASLSRLGNIGEIKFFIDQSWGADKIIVKNIGSNGLPITSFNDLAGKTICVANGNVNHFAVLAALRVAGINPINGVSWVKKDSVPDAVDAFIQGQCDVVGAWEPEASRAVVDGNGNVFVDSAWWNNITDVAVFSHQSIANKNDLMYSFTQAWMKYAKMQSEDLKTSGEQIAAWEYNGQSTNDWTYVYPGSEVDDMHLWNDTIAQAGLVENIVAMQNLGYFKLQLNGKRDAWSRANMIVDTAPYNVDTIVNPDFVQRMANDPALINTGDFPNTNFQPIPAELPNAEVSALLGLNTVVKLPCETFTFEPNSTILSDVGKSEVRTCAEAARDMILSSTGQILITGSSAWPAGYSEADITNTANGRAAAVYTEFIRMGVPASRIAVYISLPPVKDRETLNESINSKYRYTRIEVKVAGR